MIKGTKHLELLGRIKEKDTEIKKLRAALLFIRLRDKDFEARDVINEALNHE